MREFLSYKLWGDITIGDFFTLIGIIAIILYVIDSLIKYIPFFQRVKANTIGKLADTIKLRSLKKKAVSSSIEAMLNQTVHELKDELPKGWINRAVIKWVGKTIPPDFKDNQLIIRIRPTDDHDYNYLNTIYYFYSNSIFPETHQIIPSSIKEAASLYLVRRTIEDNQPYLSEQFKKHFLENITNNQPQVAGYYGDYLRIDEYGFFNSAFIREVDSLAESLRFSHERENIEIEIKNIISHLLRFEKLNKLTLLAEDDWYRTLSATSYGFILVAKPEGQRVAGIEPYVKRAKQRLRLGIKRLYILGCYAEQSFFKEVVSSLMDIREYKLEETFKLFKDYRGEASGIGALFIIDSIREKLLKNRIDIEEEEDIGSETDIADKKVPQERNEQSINEIPSPVILSEAQVTTEIISIMQTLPQREGWVFLGSIGGKLKVNYPLFNQYHYGCSTLRQLITKLNAFDIKEIGEGTAKAVYIKYKTQNDQPPKTNHKPIIKKELDEKGKFFLYLTTVVSELAANDGWSYLGKVGEKVRKDYPDFNPKKYGSSNLRHLCEDSKMFEVRKDGLGPFKSIYVKVKENTKSESEEPTNSVLSKEIIIAGVIDIYKRRSTQGEWVYLATIGHDLKKLYPKFEPLQYKSPTLRHFIETIGQFEFQQDPDNKLVTVLKYKG